MLKVIRNTLFLIILLATGCGLTAYHYYFPLYQTYKEAASEDIICFDGMVSIETNGELNESAMTWMLKGKGHAKGVLVNHEKLHLLLSETTDSAPFIDLYVTDTGEEIISLRPTLEYLLNLLDQNSKFPISFFINAIDSNMDCFVTNEQFMEMTGRKLVPNFSFNTNRIHMGDIKTFVSCVRPVNKFYETTYEAETADMHKYRVSLPDSDSFYIGVSPANNSRRVYLAGIIDGNKFETLLDLNTGDENALFDIPQSSVSDSTITILKQIFDKIMSWID